MKRLLSIFISIIMLMSVAACSKNTGTWQENYDLGMRYLSEGNYEEAIIAFNAAIEIDPKKEKAYVMLAEVYAEMGDTDSVIDVIEKAKAQGIDVSVFSEIGKVSDKTETVGQSEKSEQTEQLEQVRDQSLKDDSEEDVAASDEAVETKFNNVEKYIDLAEDYKNNGNLQDAADMLYKALDLERGNAKIYIDLQNIYKEMENFTEALSVLYEGYEITSSSEIKREIDDFFKRYTLINEIVGKEEVYGKVYSMPSQDIRNDEYVERSNMLGVKLTDNETGRKYPLCFIDIKSNMDWSFNVRDFKPVAINKDRILMRIGTAPGNYVNYIYKISKNKISELDPVLAFHAYNSGDLNGSEHFVMGKGQTYGAGDTAPVVWYTWDGIETNRIEKADCTFYEGNLYYLTEERNGESVAYNFYKSNKDGSGAEYIGSIKTSDKGSTLFVFFLHDGIVMYEWSEEGTGRVSKEINVKDIGEIVI